MRAVVAILIALWGWAAQAVTIQMEVLARGSKVGTASMEQKMLPNGSKQVVVTMELQPPTGVRTIVRQESIYAASGMPVRLIQETSVPSLRSRERVVARFEGNKITIESTRDEQTTTETEAIDPELPRRLRSEFWFIRDRPPIDKQETAYRYHLSERKWKPLTATYRGRTDVELAGRKLSAHRIDATEGVYYVDDRGDPLLIEIGDVTMRRIGAED